MTKKTVSINTTSKFSNSTFNGKFFDELISREFICGKILNYQIIFNSLAFQ